MLVQSSSQAQYTTKKKKAIANYVEGIKHARMYNFQSAILSFTKALEIESEFIEAHLNLGDVYMQQKDFEKAAQSYTSAIAI